MAWSLVSAGAIVGPTTNASASPTFGQATTSGNLLVLFAANGGNSNVPTTPTGWTLLGQGHGASRSSASVFYKVAAGSDAAPTVTNGSGDAGCNWIARLEEWSGNTATPGDQNAGATGTTSPIVATAAAADAASGNIIFACGGLRMGSNTTNVTANAYNNGATDNNEGNNDSTSTNHKYRFSHGITTGNSAADSDSFSTTVNPTEYSIAFGTFKVSGSAPPAFVPNTIVTALQAVNRAALY